MKLWKKVISLAVAIVIAILYYFVSLWSGVNGKLTVSTISFILLGILFIVCLRNISNNTHKIENTVNILLICVLVFGVKWFIDIDNFVTIAKASRIYKQTSAEMNKVNQNISYNMTFKNIKYKNDVIYYGKGFEPAMGLIYVYMDKAKAEDTKIFGDIYHSTVNIKFDYDKKSFKNRNPNFKDYSGLYSSRDKFIYILAEDCYKDVLSLSANSYNLKYTLIHEYTHHMFFQFLNDNKIDSSKIPIWFDEGIADYVAYGEEDSELPKTLVDFNSMNTITQWVNYNNNGYDTYAQSRLAVKELVEYKGSNVIKDILLETKYSDFDHAFKKVCGFTLEEFKQQLQDDMENDWQNYYDMSYDEDYFDYSKVQIQCLEKYLKDKPDNIEARTDLASLYEANGELEQAKMEYLMVLARNSSYDVAINRLAQVYIELGDFDSAISNYAKEIELTPRKSTAYSNIAQLFLLKDVDKSMEYISKAKEFDKSKYINMQYQAISEYKTAIKSDRPYEGCLKLIRSDIFYSDIVREALIAKTLKDYPNIKNSARSELEKIYENFE